MNIISIAKAAFKIAKPHLLKVGLAICKSAVAIGIENLTNEVLSPFILSKRDKDIRKAKKEILVTTQMLNKCYDIQNDIIKAYDIDIVEAYNEVPSFHKTENRNNEKIEDFLNAKHFKNINKNVNIKDFSSKVSKSKKQFDLYSDIFERNTGMHIERSTGKVKSV